MPSYSVSYTYINHYFTLSAKDSEMNPFLASCRKGICSKYNPVMVKREPHMEKQELTLSLISIFTSMFISKQNARNSR